MILIKKLKSKILLNVFFLIQIQFYVSMEILKLFYCNKRSNQRLSKKYINLIKYKIIINLTFLKINLSYIFLMINTNSLKLN